MIARLFWIFVATIVYAYGGYPAVLAILAKRRPRSPRSVDAGLAEILPSVTLLIAAYNEETSIQQKIENSLQLDYPRELVQIVVAADGSDDRTPEIVSRFAAQGVELSYIPPRRGKLAAINRAMSLARGTIVVFSDANNLYDAGTLRALVAPFSNPAVGAVCGAKSIVHQGDPLGASDGLYWAYESKIKELESRVGSCTGVSGEILAIRRDLFEPAPDHVINDDFFIAMRIIRRGYRVVYAPSARSYEAISSDPRDERTRRSRIVAGRYQSMMLAPQLLTPRQPLIAWQVVSHKFLRPLVPWAMAGALITNVLAAMKPARPLQHPLRGLHAHVARILLLGQALFYAAAWIGTAKRPRGRLGRLFSVPAFLTNSNFAAAVGLFRFLTKRETVLWSRVPRSSTMEVVHATRDNAADEWPGSVKAADV